MRIILIGAPGSGKGTQAESIRQKYPIAHISTGDILRANVKADTDLQECKRVYGSRKTCADDVIVAMVESRLQEPDCKEGFLLDGFPRTKPQLKRLTLC
jgi:adenylate kinase